MLHRGGNKSADVIWSQKILNSNLCQRLNSCTVVTVSTLHGLSPHLGTLEPAHSAWSRVLTIEVLVLRLRHCSHVPRPFVCAGLTCGTWQFGTALGCGSESSRDRTALRGGREERRGGSKARCAPAVPCRPRPVRSYVLRTRVGAARRGHPQGHEERLCPHPRGSTHAPAAASGATTSSPPPWPTAAAPCVRHVAGQPRRGHVMVRSGGGRREPEVAIGAAGGAAPGSRGPVVLRAPGRRRRRFRPGHGGRQGLDEAREVRPAGARSCRGGCAD